MNRSILALPRLLLALALSAAVPLAASAADAPDVEQIVRKTNRAVYYQGDDSRARVTMTIKDSNGRQQVKEFTILRREVGDGEGDQRLYIYFHAPEIARGTAFMVWKHADREDDRWLYVPSLDQQKRIPATHQRASFVGSHFFHEDVSGRRVTDDCHELVRVTDTHYVLKSTPKAPDLVEFDWYMRWIDKETFIPLEVKYWKDEKAYRIAKTLVVEDVQGHKTVTKSQIWDRKTAAATTMEYRSVEYDVDLPDDLFTERSLAAPPTEHLK